MQGFGSSSNINGDIKESCWIATVKWGSASVQQQMSARARKQILFSVILLARPLFAYSVWTSAWRYFLDKPSCIENGIVWETTPGLHRVEWTVVVVPLCTVQLLQTDGGLMVLNELPSRMTIWDCHALSEHRHRIFYQVKKQTILFEKKRYTIITFAHITHRMKLPKCWMSLFGIRLIRLENTRIFQFSFEFESRTPSSSVLNVDSSNSRTIVGKKGDYHVQNFVTAGSRSTPRKRVPMPSKIP